MTPTGQKSGRYSKIEGRVSFAAVHGRGYISTHPADVTSNLSIDHHVLEASGFRC